jgi:hypothetical protein
MAAMKKPVVGPLQQPKKKLNVLPKPTPKATKKAAPKTLNDYLKQGKRPPIKKGLKVPSDADVIIKGYNDKKTLQKYKGK